MRNAYLAGVGGVALLGLFGCNKAADLAGGGAPHGHGRFQGVGLYAAGEMWPQVAGATAPKDAAASKLDDDDTVIVLIDSETGEVRQCGNFSGVCVGMKPWAAPLASGQMAPVVVTKHRERLNAEAEAKVQPKAAT